MADDNRTYVRATQDEIAQRRRQVATLRLAHFTQEEIAERLNVSRTTITADLKAIRDEWAERRSAAYQEWVAEEIAKLDALERAWLPRALSQIPDEKAVTKVLSIMDRRARMLGLDQPERFQVQVVTVDMIDAEIARLERQLQGATDDVIELTAGEIEDTNETADTEQ